MAARASLITLQDQKDNQILIGSNLFLSNKIYDKNNFEKVFSMYDWHWEFNYYDTSFASSTNNNINISVDIFKNILYNKKPINSTPFYVHSQSLNHTTDILPTWDIVTKTIRYYIYSGYNKGIVSTEATPTYQYDRKPLSIESINYFEHKISSYTRNDIFLHMTGNCYFNEDIYFTAASYIYSRSPAGYALSSNNSQVPPFNTLSRTYLSFKYVLSINENIIDINNLSKTQQQEQLNIDATTTDLEHIKQFRFKKGWNKIDILILLDNLNESKFTQDFQTETLANAYILSKSFFSLGWSPSTRNYNPNVKINGTTLLINNAPTISTIYFNNTNDNDSIVKRYISVFTSTFPNLNDFPTNQLQINNINDPTSFFLQQSSKELYIASTNYPKIKYIMPYFNHIYNIDYTLSIDSNTKYKYFIDTIEFINQATKTLNFRIEFKFKDNSNSTLISFNLSQFVYSSSQIGSSYLFHDLNISIPNNSYILSYDLFDSTTNSSIKSGVHPYTIKINIVELEDSFLTSKMPTLDITNDYSINSKSIIFYDGSVGIGTTDTHNYSLYVDNITNKKKGIYCTDDITILSDIAHKNNICNISNPLDKIKKLRGVTYQRTDRNDNKTHMGLIAQEVQQIVPEVVQDDGKGVAYANLIALLIEGIKELDDKISKLS